MNVHILIALLVGITKFTQGDLMKKPMGIKMCERQCQCLKGCYAIQYDTVSLQCTTLTDPKDEVKGSPSLLAQTVSSDKDSSLSCRPQVCSEGEHSVINRFHQPVCVPSDISANVKNMSPAWLLALPLHPVQVEMAFRMNLDTKEIEQCPFFWSDVRAVLPVRSENKYFIALKSFVVSSPMNTRQDVIVWHGHIESMCLDEERKIVFLSSNRNPNELSLKRMNTDGMENRYVTDIKMNGIGYSHIDIDPGRKNIYIMNFCMLMSVSYDGRKKKIIYSSDSQLPVMTYDASREIVYFVNMDQNILVRVQVQGKRSEVLPFDKCTEVSSAVNNAGILYLLWFDDIVSFNMDGDSEVYSLPQHPDPSGWRLFVM